MYQLRQMWMRVYFHTSAVSTPSFCSVRSIAVMSAARFCDCHYSHSVCASARATAAASVYMQCINFGRCECASTIAIITYQRRHTVSLQQSIHYTRHHSAVPLLCATPAVTVCVRKSKDLHICSTSLGCCVRTAAHCHLSTIPHRTHSVLCR